MQVRMLPWSAATAADYDSTTALVIRQTRSMDPLIGAVGPARSGSSFLIAVVPEFSLRLRSQGLFGIGVDDDGGDGVVYACPIRPSVTPALP